MKLSQVAPSQGNLAVHVQASRGLVERRSRTASSTSSIPPPPVAEWIPDASGPTRRVVLGGLPPGALKSGNGPSSAGASKAQDRS